MKLKLDHPLYFLARRLRDLWMWRETPTVTEAMDCLLTDLRRFKRFMVKHAGMKAHLDRKHEPFKTASGIGRLRLLVESEQGTFALTGFTTPDNKFLDRPYAQYTVLNDDQEKMAFLTYYAGIQI